MNVKISAASLVVALGITGCANTSDEAKTPAGGIGAGALAGGLIGAVLGGQRGAASGAASGAAAGGVVGDRIARTKADYVSREDMIQKETGIVQSRFAETQRMNQKLRVALASLQQDAKRLSAERS